MQFYLGTHQPAWLRQTDVPLFVSTRRLSHRHHLPRARGAVAIDSAGYSELSLYGEWRTTSQRYVADVRRYAAEIGRVEWAAVQDWMCEPSVRARTGKSVAEHQTLTIRSVLELRSLAPEIAWAPVLQGYVADDLPAPRRSLRSRRRKPVYGADRGRRYGMQTASHPGGVRHPSARTRAQPARLRFQEAGRGARGRIPRLGRFDGVEFRRAAAAASRVRLQDPQELR